MTQKGAIHLLIPILVLLGAGILVGSNMTTFEKFPDEGNVQGVLVAKGDDDNSGSGSSGSGSSGRDGSDNSSGSSGSSGSNSEQKTEIRTDEGRVKTEVRDDRARVEVRQGGRKERIEIRNGIVTIKSEIEDEDDREDELEDEDSGEVEDDEEEATPSASSNHQLENRIRSIAKFPLRIDLATNQLIMTKNGVERVLTVLPEHAVQNMLRAHLKKGLGPKFFGVLSPSASPSASPLASPSASPDASPSATPEATPPPEATESAGITVLESQIELEEKEGKFVYKIPALKHLRVLGVIPVTTQFTAYVSAESGNLLEEQQSLLARILDLLSP